MMRLRWLTLSCCLLSCGGNVKRDPQASALPTPEPPPALEDSRGIVGGPRDETAFEFEPEHETRADQPPVLDGIPEIPERISTALAPYLAGRQAKIAAVDSTLAFMVVLTRLQEVTQAYRIGELLGAPQQLTEGDSPIAQAVLVPGREKELLYRRDRDGDEQYQIFRLKLDTGIEERLSNGKSRHGTFSLARNGALAFSNNQRSPGDMDVYTAPVPNLQNVDPLVARGGQWTAGSWSRDSDKLLVRHYRSADSSSMYLADTKSGELSPLSLGKSEAVMRDARFGRDTSSIYVVSDAGEDIAELYSLDLKSGQATSLSRGIPWEVELVAVAQDRAKLAFVANEDGYSVLYFVDQATGERTSATGIPRGVISTLQYVGSTGAVALTLATATEPADAFVYEPGTATLQRWTRSASDALADKALVEPELIRYKSHDDLEIPAYVYRPRGEAPFPVLLWIHGGPEAQHRPSFDPVLQYFVAELGIAVIAPNVRGSSGYGRRFLGLDDGVKRGDAVGDIGALLDWVQTQPDLNSERVGIFGASYGGFMVLAALAQYGERLAAGCDLVGISHFVRFLENTSAYRRDARRAEYGDERIAEVREVLEALSPLTNAAKIRTPLLVGHGANDPRVPLAEAEQIMQVVRDKGSTVWYFLARDEGHGFRKRRSRDLFYSVMSAFFETHLLGDGPAVDDTDSPLVDESAELESSDAAG